MTKLRTQLEQLRDDVRWWHWQYADEEKDSRTDTERSYCDGKKFGAWHVLQHINAILDAAPAPEPEGKWRRLGDDETIQAGDRCTDDVPPTVPVSRNMIGKSVSWFVNAIPKGGYVERRVENAKRSKWVSVCDHLPPVGLTVCVKVADDPDPQADWINDMSEWETETHITHWRPLPKFKAERDS
jgi:hypothetical protein